MATTTKKTAKLDSIAGSGITGEMTFTQTLNANGSGKMVVTGKAHGIPSPTTLYVSLCYGVGSSPTGPTPCRDDGSLGGVILDPQDILTAPDLLKNALGGVPLIGPVLAPVNKLISNVLVPRLQTGLGPLSSINMPPPGGMLFSPKATARMFLGVWAPANKQGDAVFKALPKTWTGPDDLLGIPFTKINTVSIRQPQFPLLAPNPLKDVRPQIFQLRACGPII